MEILSKLFEYLATTFYMLAQKCAVKRVVKLIDLENASKSALTINGKKVFGTRVAVIAVVDNAPRRLVLKDLFNYNLFVRGNVKTANCKTLFVRGNCVNREKSEHDRF